MKIDMQAFLQDHDIDIRIGGKNVWSSGGYIGVCCPECGDDSFHFNVKKDGTKAFCFRCSNKKSGAYNIAKVLDILDVNSKELQKYFVSDDSKFSYEDTSIEKKDTLEFYKLWNKFPVITDDKQFSIFHKYLDKRGLNDIWNMTEIRANKKDYSVVFPVYNSNKAIVSFVERNISEYNKLRYKNCPSNIALESLSKILWHPDFTSRQVKRKNYAIIVEGIFDSLKFSYLGGMPSFAILRKKLSDDQTTFLYNIVDENSTIYLALDSEGVTKEEKQDIVSKLSLVFNKVKILSYSTKDAGEMNKKQVQIVKNLLEKDNNI